MEYSNIILESHDQYASITLNRPDKLNTINYELLSELGQAIDEINEMAEVRVIVVKGAGRTIDGVEAERIGFINRAVEPEALEAEVKKWAEELMGLPPLAVGLGKRMVDKALDMDILTSLDMNAQAQSMLIKTEDFTEAMRARVEKRRPQFKGK